MRAKEQTEAYIISASGNLLGKLSVHQAVTAGDKLVKQFCDEILSSSKKTIRCNMLCMLSVILLVNRYRSLMETIESF